MPFGPKNAPAVFQRMMNAVLVTCKAFTAVYLDDVLVFSSNRTEHEAHLLQVLSCLESAGLQLNLRKFH